MDRRDDQAARATVTALAIAAALPLLGGAGNIEATRDLSLMSVALAFGCCVLCVRMVREYYSSMWTQLRREAPLCERDEGAERALLGQRRRPPSTRAAP